MRLCSSFLLPGQAPAGLISTCSTESSLIDGYRKKAQQMCQPHKGLKRARFSTPRQESVRGQKEMMNHNIHNHES